MDRNTLTVIGLLMIVVGLIFFGLGVLILILSLFGGLTKSHENSNRYSKIILWLIITGILTSTGGTALFVSNCSLGSMH